MNATCHNCESDCLRLINHDECCQCRDSIFGDARSTYCEFCADRCDRQSERNYEAFCEDFYGGEVETLNQQHRRLHEEKRKLS